MLLLTAMAAAMIAAMLAMLLLLIATTAIVATTAATRVGGWSAGRLERSHHEGCLERCLERSPQFVLRLSACCVCACLSMCAQAVSLLFVRMLRASLRVSAPLRFCAHMCVSVRLRASTIAMATNH